MDPFVYILPPETAEIHCVAADLAFFQEALRRSASSGERKNFFRLAAAHFAKEQLSSKGVS
jgi:hypothetical protein